MQRPRDFLRVLTQCVKSGRVDAAQGELLISYSGMVHLMSDYRDFTRSEIKNNSLAAYLLEELRGDVKTDTSDVIVTPTGTERRAPPRLKQEEFTPQVVQPTATTFVLPTATLPSVFNSLVTDLKTAGMSVKKSVTTGATATFEPQSDGDLTGCEVVEQLATGTLKGRFANRVPMLVS